MTKDEELRKRNLIRARHIGIAEFEIANKEFSKEQKGWWKHTLDYNSFIRGFVSGMAYIKRDCSMVEDKPKEIQAQKQEETK